MTDYPLVYDLEARRDLTRQFDFILERSGDIRAIEFVDRIEAFVEKLGSFPEIGRVLTSVAVSIRAIAFKRQVYVVYAFDGVRVVVLRVFNKGQDVESWLHDMLDNTSST